MHAAVRQHDIARPKHRIVTHDLRKDLLIDRHIGSLAFGDKQRTGTAVHNHDIGTLRLAVERHGIFGHDTSGLRPAVRHEVGHEVLPHPLLGRQHEVLPAQRVPDFDLRALPPGAQPNGRKIEFGEPEH